MGKSADFVMDINHQSPWHKSRKSAAKSATVTDFVTDFVAKSVKWNVGYMKSFPPICRWINQARHRLTQLQRSGTKC